MTALVTARSAAPSPSSLFPLDTDAAVDRVVRLAAVLALWVGLLLITYWWAADGGVTDLGHWESGLTSLGRLSGLIIAGYSSGRWSELLATTWELITAYGSILLAAAGTACLIMVVLTSLKASRRRLRYESWHLLHIYGYLGVGLALPYQLWRRQELLCSPAATVHWWTLWATASSRLRTAQPRSPR